MTGEVIVDLLIVDRFRKEPGVGCHKEVYWESNRAARGWVFGVRRLVQVEGFDGTVMCDGNAGALDGDDSGFADAVADA